MRNKKENHAMKFPKILSAKLLAIFLGVMFVGTYAFADASVVAPQDFLAQVLAAIHQMGGLSMMLKISAIITLVIASFKVSFLNQYVWSKLGAFKVWAAPLLGLIAGVLGLGVSGPVTAPMVFAYVAAGGGAVFLHEILDSVKAIPGLGDIYKSLIDIVEGALGGGDPALK